MKKEETIQKLKEMCRTLGRRNKFRLLVKWTTRGIMAPIVEADAELVNVVLTLARKFEKKTNPQIMAEKGSTAQIERLGIRN